MSTDQGSIKGEQTNLVAHCAHDLRDMWWRNSGWRWCKGTTAAAVNHEIVQERCWSWRWQNARQW